MLREGEMLLKLLHHFGSTMYFTLQPWQLYVVILAGWAKNAAYRLG